MTHKNNKHNKMDADAIFWSFITEKISSNPEMMAGCNSDSPENQLAMTVIALRSEVGLSQREFAARIGMKQSQLARIETGRQVPKLKTLAKLASVAGYEVKVSLVPFDRKSGQGSGH
ncbi:MAG: helix-turn-helix transcriptional regulator [Cyanobacteria bacterium P01_G01_bin.39]